ncbi:MAG TPA: type II toxin-antitoxin system VapC family toxin [Gaiellaceae bacterium]|nr:type II toxin-antitoxin system VapC family toxin [Gaiellaceae bacterium]
MPALLNVEVANALLGYRRSDRLSLDDAAGVLHAVRALPVQRMPLRVLTTAALAVAVERGLSVYDACYVVVAEALEAPLLTADSRLADASDRSVLIV